MLNICGSPVADRFYKFSKEMAERSDFNNYSIFNIQ